jgi:ribonuclease HIII
MTDNSIKTFQDEVQRKIRNLLAEFGEGKLSNEQFNILYERYNNQLEMALQARDEQMAVATGGESTIAIKQATIGKAIGMAIYHHRSGTIIETLGTFDLSPDVISHTINEFSHKLEQRQFIEPVTRKLSSGIWVVFMARHFTTAVVIFKNEPAPRQIRELERLLHDFEEANSHNLDKLNVEKDKLAKPFLGFVRRKLTQ